MDVLGRPRALKTLVAVLERGPMTQREFIEVSGYVNELAKKLRDELKAAGLLEVREKPIKGSVTVFEISLTPLGKRIAQKGQEIERLMRESAPEKADR